MHSLVLNTSPQTNLTPIVPDAFKSDLVEKQAAFAEFIAKHGRSYASKDHAEERFSIFSQNFDAIKAHNALGTFEKGVNAYADLTSAELESMLHRAALNAPQKRLQQAAIMNLNEDASVTGNLPEEVNWHN
jgi:hypothetical protein